MDDPANHRSAAPPTAQEFWTTFVLIFVVIGVLFLADASLARIDRQESRSEAQTRFREGLRLTRNGNYLEAVDRLRTAAFIERTNRDYRLALAEALAGARKFDDATAQLDEVLSDHPTWGPANLAMARAMLSQDRVEDAISYYHRAIYGQWPDDTAASRVRVRFELISLLVRENAHQELLAELLPLLDEAPDSLPLRKQLGRLFLVAGSPTRASTIFREILDQAPADADAYAGLGDADFALGNFRSARLSLLTARRLAPDDSSIARRLELVNQVFALDPMRRGLGTAEQLRRSRVLLERASQALAECSGPERSVVATAVLDSARIQLERRGRRAATLDANLDLAERIWGMRQTGCATPAPDDDPLALVLARLAQ